jgi:hypothetical protein
VRLGLLCASRCRSCALRRCGLGLRDGSLARLAARIGRAGCSIGRRRCLAHGRLVRAQRWLRRFNDARCLALRNRGETFSSTAPAQFIIENGTLSVQLQQTLTFICLDAVDAIRDGKSLCTRQ